MTDNLLNQPDQGEPQIDPNKNYLEELVGPDKKFKTVEDMAKGKYFADQMLEIKNKREDQMREDYLKLREDNMAKAKLEELIDQLKSERLASSDNTHNANEDNKKPVIDTKEIQSLVSSEVQRISQEKKDTENFNLVKSKLTERFGENYQSSVKSQIDSLGLSIEDFNSLAKKSPVVLFRTLGMDKQEQDLFQTPARSSQRNDTFAPTGAKKRTWSYYQELRKKDPMAWLDRNTATQMSKDAVELGDAFRDGDYFVKGLHDE